MLTESQIQLPAEPESMKDDHFSTFVMLGEQRVRVRSEALEELGLRQGQEVNGDTVMEILKWNIAYAERQIAGRKSREG